MSHTHALRPLDVTGYWPYVPHRCARCGAIVYVRCA